MPRYLQLHLLLFQHHAGRDFEIRTVNRSSLHLYVNLPPEFDRIPYAVAASDFARMALLATHGGLYADLDFLVTRSLSPIRKLLDQYEIVSYISKDGSKDDPTPTTEHECQQHFVSNFAAARNGSAFMMEVWTVFRQ
jgi:mannosyltransferase OCH1-like enzyme